MAGWYDRDVLADSGIVSYLPCDELSGSTAFDLSPTAVNGTLGSGLVLGAVPFLAGGRAPWYPGTSTTGYVQLADNNAWSIGTTGLLTIEMWVWSGVDGQSSGTNTLFGKMASGFTNYEYLCYCGSGSAANLVETQMLTSAGGVIAKSVNGAPLLRRWTHHIIHFPGTSTTSYPQHFINGRPSSAITNTAGSGSVSNANSPLTFGMRVDDTANYRFVGSICRIAISNAAPSQRMLSRYQRVHRRLALAA